MRFGSHLARFLCVRVFVLGLGFAIGLLQSGSAQAEQFEFQALLPGDLAEGGGGEFGRAVAIWRDYIVVGASGDAPQEDPWLADGAVYVYQFEDGVWVERAKLKGSETGWEDQLGWSVAIDGDLIVAGAPHLTTEGSGLEARAYVFRRDDNGTPDDGADDVWVEEAILAPDPSDRQFSDGFAGSVAVSGDTIVAGAAGAGIIDLTDLQRAYVFRRDCTDWVQEAILVGWDTQPGHRFARTVSVSGHIIVAGGNSTPGKGAAYVFRGESHTWIQETRLDGEDTQEGDLLGSRVSVSGDTLIVGAYRRDESGLYFGRTYVFRRSAALWTAEANLTPLRPQHGDAFGSTVAITRASLVVGARADAHAGMDAGSAYLYRRTRTGWLERGKLVASDAHPGAQFGQSVGVSGAYAVVGGGGGAYVYVVVGDKLSLSDFAEFQECFGRGGSLNECAVLDLVPDARIDLKDYVELQVRLGNP